MLKVCDEFGQVHELGNMCWMERDDGTLVIFNATEDDVRMIFRRFSWLSVQ